MAWHHHRTDVAQAARHEQRRFNPLSIVLVGIGLACSAGASVFTYQLLHEPLEAVGASVITHMASSNCTAIGQALTGLALARSRVITGEGNALVAPQGAHTSIGVFNTAQGTLEQFSSSHLNADQAIEVLRRLPREPISKPGLAARGARSAGQSCQHLDYGLNPSVVRVYAVPGHPNGWLALLHGPWSAEGAAKTSFVLLDLPASALEISGLDSSQQTLLPGGPQPVNLTVSVQPLERLNAPTTRAAHVPQLMKEDRVLQSQRSVPFANQGVRTVMSINHEALDRVSWRTAGMVGGMGIVATTALVLISNRSERRLRQLNRALLQESRTDSLTRIANRRAWDESLAREESRRQRHGQPYGLIVVDLDGFKQINDRRGHKTGDALLQAAAEQLGGQLRSGDVLARVGGDEFALLVFNPAEPGLADVVERLRKALETVGIAASIGAALSEPRTTLDQTWAKADAAMYAMKSGFSAAAAPSPS